MDGSCGRARLVLDFNVGRAPAPCKPSAVKVTEPRRVPGLLPQPAALRRVLRGSGQAWACPPRWASCSQPRRLRAPAPASPLPRAAEVGAPPWARLPIAHLGVGTCAQARAVLALRRGGPCQVQRSPGGACRGRSDRRHRDPAQGPLHRGAAHDRHRSAAREVHAGSRTGPPPQSPLHPAGAAARRQEAKRWLAYGADCHDLLSRPEVYAKIRAWLSGSDRAEDLLSRSARAG